MKKLLSLALCCMAFLVLWAGGAWGTAGTVTCVDNATDLQTALTTAQSNGTNDLIKVVHGTYAGHFTYVSDDGYNITLQGGYTAGCTGRVVDPSLTILDGASTGTTVLYLYNTNGGNIQVDGFTIQNGTGGGVYAWSYSASATAGDITLVNNTITGNSTGGAGGGVHAQTNSDSGTAGSVTLLNNTIQGNSASNGNWGGGVQIVSSAPVAAGTVTFTNNTITGNSATGGGQGGGVTVQHYSGVGTGADAIIFTDNTITGNTAQSNGGVFADAVSNTGTTGNVTFTNNTIAGNSASNAVGGVWVRSYSLSATGGIVTVTNNTVTGNTASNNDYAGGLYLTRTGNTINCYNNIIWGNTSPSGGDIYLAAGTGVGTFNGYNNDYTNIHGNWDNEGGNINADPLFVNATIGDYHLSPVSPCMDTGLNGAPGIPALDFEGDARIIDGNNDSTATVDMGADEYNGALLSACVATAADLQAALTEAEENDRNDVIMVVQGTYTGNFTYNSNQGFSITLQGGYLAGCASRVVNPVNTILDGGSTARVLYLRDDSGGDIQVDGFTIQNGNSTGAGGGVFAASDSDSGVAGNITLLNNIIQGNTAPDNYGGGAYIQAHSDTGTGGTVTLLNNTIQGNTATDGGGGVFVQTHSGVGTAGAGAIIFIDNTIQGNSAGGGVGVYAVAGSTSGTAGAITFTNNTIAGNSASIGSAGGVFASSSASSGTGGTVTYTNNTITGNTASTIGGLQLYKTDNTINCYNNIIWGNTAPDIYLAGVTGTANGYNNDYATMAGSWTDAGGNINADPLFVGSGDYHLRPASPCIDAGVNSAPGIPATDFEGDARIIDGNNDGTALADMGADEYSGFPPNGTIFAGCSLINKYQPTFRWTGLVGPFKSYTIYFSTSATDFATKGIFITKANIKGTMSSYIPSAGVWKKIFTASWNGGTIRNIYWKVIGTRQDKSTASSAVWNFSVDASYPPEIIAPTEGATLSAAALPTFTFDTACNVKFRLEISSVSNFSDPKKIKTFSYSVKDPNAMFVFTKALSSGQWKSVQKLIGTNTGYFRIKGWDVIKREADSATQSFTITP